MTLLRVAARTLAAAPRSAKPAIIPARRVDFTRKPLAGHEIAARRAFARQMAQGAFKGAARLGNLLFYRFSHARRGDMTNSCARVRLLSFYHWP